MTILDIVKLWNEYLGNAIAQGLITIAECICGGFILYHLKRQKEFTAYLHKHVDARASASISKLTQIVEENQYRNPQEELAADLWKASRSQNPSVQDAISNLRMIVKLSGE